MEVVINPQVKDAKFNLNILRWGGFPENLFKVAVGSAEMNGSTADIPRKGTETLSFRNLPKSYALR